MYSAIYVWKMYVGMYSAVYVGDDVCMYRCMHSAVCMYEKMYVCVVRLCMYVKMYVWQYSAMYVCMCGV